MTTTIYRPRRGRKAVRIPMNSFPAGTMHTPAYRLSDDTAKLATRRPGQHVRRMTAETARRVGQVILFTVCLFAGLLLLMLGLSLPATTDLLRVLALMTSGALLMTFVLGVLDRG